MLTNIREPFEWARYSSVRRDTVGAGAAKAHLAMVKQFYLGAFTILLAGAAVAANMALKIAIFLPPLITIDPRRMRASRFPRQHIWTDR